MICMRRFAVVTAIVLGAASLAAQLRVQPVAEHPDEVTLRLLLRKLASSGTFMQTTAHPDDEDNGLLAMMGHGRGMRSVLVTATRGDGGQNEIGPELFEALSVLRTEELMAAHRVDGAEQHFTRAVDFGYSFSVEESLRLWGHQEILGDFVRLIRAVRPDVIAGFICDGDGGGQHHQASTVLTREAFRAAAEASRYPEQIDEGLRPWQALRLFCTDRSSFTQVPRGQATLVTIPNSFEPLLGRGYNDLGIEARSMHKCQGTSQLLPLPGQSFSRVYRLEQSRVPFAGAPNDLFAGIDTSLQGLARFAGAQPSAALVDALGTIANAVVSAERAVRERGLQAASPPLAAGLGRVRQLRANLVSMPFDDTKRFEIDFRLRQK
jgi:LmbE family N-acetylglucosaminyl deacetylase